MRKELRNKRVVKIKVRTPGGRVAIHFRKPIRHKAYCQYCGRKLSKGTVCPSCERRMIINKFIA